MICASNWDKRLEDGLRITSLGVPLLGNMSTYMRDILIVIEFERKLEAPISLI